MASTNKTPNYNLSQFVGTDIPQWLTDYNNDMSKIDTQMKANNTQTESNTDMITEIQDYFNLNDITTFTNNEINIPNGTKFNTYLQLVTNNNKTLFKLYGSIIIKSITPTASPEIYSKATIQTDLHPSEDMTIYGCTNIIVSNAVDLKTIARQTSFTIKTDGTIEFEYYSGYACDEVNVILPPCIYFLKSFGDNPPIESLSI